jgi:hypothetical protein
MLNFESRIRFSSNLGKLGARRNIFQADMKALQGYNGKNNEQKQNPMEWRVA